MSKETAAEMNKGSLCTSLNFSAHLLQRRHKNQKALWSFSGLTGAERQRWYSLLESECFCFKRVREVFPVSLTFGKAGKSYQTGS